TVATGPARPARGPQRRSGVLRYDTEGLRISADAALDLGDRVALYQHARGCDRCRVALASRDGRTLHYLSPQDTPAAYPLWVGPAEVRFALGEGEDSHIARVTVR